ncbi:MAG: hypothetical protein KBA31_18065 [Alphaproteobacteria bacterium]|nr:hypothetical protein [Alphaproteobacteria bacterium]
MMTVLKWIVRLFAFLLVAAAIAYPVADLMRVPSLCPSVCYPRPMN